MSMVKKNFLFALAALVAMEANAVGFKTLSMAEGIEMAKGNPKAVILLTLEKITKESAAKVLPDKSQMIFIYCRSGRRSKIAANKLHELGYTNLIEFGGILDYTGPVEK